MRKTDYSDLDENSGVQIDSSRKQKIRKPSKASNVAKVLQFMEKNEEVRQAQLKTRANEKHEERIAKQKRHEERMHSQNHFLKFSLHPCQKKKKDEKVRRRRESTEAAMKSS